MLMVKRICNVLNDSMANLLVQLFDIPTRSQKFIVDVTRDVTSVVLKTKTNKNMQVFYSLFIL